MMRRIWSLRFSRPPAPRKGAFHPMLENLEERAVPALVSPTVNVYTESNNPAQNAVLAFHSNPTNGSLTQIGTYDTGGIGERNLPKTVGPDDGDKQVVTSPNGQFLYAVNEGSNSLTAFRIQPDGSLQTIGTYASQGIEPDSISVVGSRLYVANRGDASSAGPGSANPNISGFNVASNGSLSFIPGSTVTFPVGTFATQVLETPDQHLLFVQLASLAGTVPGNSLVPYQILSNGTLQAAPGGPASASPTPALQLGAALDPDQNIIYAGLTLNSAVGVYTYDDTGRTTFVGSAADQGAGVCWCTVSADGRFLYVGNTVADSIGVFSLADPLHPVEVQDLSLKGQSTDSNGANQVDQFEIGLNPTNDTLYAVGQSTSATGSFQAGNQLHTLTVASNGTLTEASAPLLFSPTDVPGDAHPQGIAVAQSTGTLPGITVANQGPDLLITATGDNEPITVQVSPGDVNVVSLNGTPVSYAQGFNAGQFDGNVLLTVGNNGDNVQIANSYVPGNVILDGSAASTSGADSWTIHDSSIGGSLVVNQAAGSVTLSVANAYIGANTDLTFLGTASTVTLSNLSIPGTVNVINEVNGTGSLTITNAYLGALNDTLGSGTNVLSIGSATVLQANLTPGSNSAGNDLLWIQNAYLNSLSAVLGSGNNAVSINDATLQEADLIGGNGYNTLSIGNAYIGSLSATHFHQ